MTARLLATVLPYLIIGMLAVALVLFMLALQQLRRGRTGPYWRLRRQAGERGGQLFLLSVTVFGVALAIAFFSGLADLALQQMRSALSSDPNGLRGVVLPTLTEIPLTSMLATPTTQPTPSAAATLTEMTIPTATETPAPTGTSSPTLTPTITQTATQTLTPTPTFESVLALTPATSEQEPPRQAMIELVAASSELTPDQTPQGQQTPFTVGIRRIYFFLHYDHMENGVTWTRILYREGVPIQGHSYRWSQGSAGEGFFFFGDDGGYPAGTYEVRLFIGSEESSRLVFNVAEL